LKSGWCTKEGRKPKQAGVSFVTAMRPENRLSHEVPPKAVRHVPQVFPWWETSTSQSSRFPAQLLKLRRA
jgi:hypothetical protein